MENINLRKSTLIKIIAITLLLFILIYGFYLKNNLTQDQRSLVSYCSIVLVGFGIILQGKYSTITKKKVRGSSAYLFGAAAIAFGFVRILSIYNII